MITLPASQAAGALVDWLETSLLTQDGVRISDTAIIDVLAEADLSDPDELLAVILQTVRSRGHIVGNGYPIRRDGLGFARVSTWRRYLPYSFMLFASLNQSYEELRYRGGAANRP